MKRKLQNKNSKLLLLLLLVFLNNCASIPDKPFCVDEKPGVGFCVTLVTGRQFHIDDTHPFIDENGKSNTWFDLQLGVIKMPLETFKALKKYLIDECKMSNKCNKDIGSWDRNLSVLELK